MDDAGERTEAAPRRRTTRRAFLAVTGTAVGSAALLNALGGDASAEVLDATAAQLSPDDSHSGGSITVRRPLDQLLLTFSFVNCQIDYSQSPPVLRKIAADASLPAQLCVSFGSLARTAPMHVEEQAYPLVGVKNQPVQSPPGPTPTPTASATVPLAPVGSRISGGSGLVFTLPDAMVAPGANPLPIDTQHLLDFVAWSLSVTPNAVPPFTSAATAPAGLGIPEPPTQVTSIELPTNLIISPPAKPRLGGAPLERTVFVNATAPVTHNGWTELWHTRLAAYIGTPINPTPGAKPDLVRPPLYSYAVDETERSYRTVRAVWCLDSKFGPDYLNEASDNQLVPDDPFTTPLSYADRYDLVRLTSDFGTQPGAPYGRAGFIPQPATVDNLMLSALGGWLDCSGHWDLPEQSGKAYNSSLLQWRQRTVQGRDSYVRTVRKGFLFPWGTKASLVTIAERQFTVAGKNPLSAGAVGAYLREKTYLVVADPVTSYAGNTLMPFGGLELPFVSVTAITKVTPDFTPPTSAYVSQAPNPETIFEPKINGTPYAFHYQGVDRNGDVIDFHSPVLWVDSTAAYADNPTSLTQLQAAVKKWSSSPPLVDFGGQRVTMAAPKFDKTTAATGSYTGDTQLVVASMNIGATLPLSTTNLASSNQPAFFPRLASAQISLPQAAAASGNGIAPVPMVYEPTVYLKDGSSGRNGFTHNPGGVFLKAVSPGSSTVTFSAGSSGGALTPNLNIAGYSRELGPASGNLGQLAKGSFDPASVFAGTGAKLLGAIPIQDILSAVTFGSGANAKALSLTSLEFQNPHRIVTVLDWHPEIQSDPNNIFVPTGDVSDSLNLHAQIVTYLPDDGPPSSTSIVTGQLSNFTLNLFGDGDTHFITIPFDSLIFRAQTGKKTDVAVKIADSGVQFVGALSFVQDLASYLSFDGSGLTVDTAGDAITADLTLALPNITVGVLSLLNLAFSAGVAIPYSGDPVRLSFAFSSRENPFQIEVMVFSGGGFIGLGLGADGVKLLEFSFDFGLGYSVDIGIASGQVSLTAGIYYESDDSSGTQEIDLTAWVKASGGISALGVISVSVELYLALSYQSDSSGSSLAGDAELSISVHIIFFGFTVGFSIHEQFAGSGSSPSSAPATARTHRGLAGSLAPAGAPEPSDNYFGATMTAADWTEYCSSFALLGVGN